MEKEVTVETSLKNLLEIMLKYYEYFIQNDDDLKQIEDKLEDYETINQLVSLISNVFTSLTTKIDIHINSEEVKEGGYKNLEKFVQKLEAEVRNHISVEQQMKLYSESLQEQLDTSEKIRQSFFHSTKKLLCDLKRDNSLLNQKLSTLKIIGQQKKEMSSKLIFKQQECKEQSKEIRQLKQKLMLLENRKSYSKVTSPRKSSRHKPNNSISSLFDQKSRKKSHFKQGFESLYQHINKAKNRKKSIKYEFSLSKKTQQQYSNRSKRPVIRSKNSSFLKNFSKGHKRSKSNQQIREKSLQGSKQDPQRRILTIKKITKYDKMSVQMHSLKKRKKQGLY